MAETLKHLVLCLTLVARDEGDDDSHQRAEIADRRYAAKDWLAFNATTWYDHTNYFETATSDCARLGGRLRPGTVILENVF